MKNFSAFILFEALLLLTGVGFSFNMAQAGGAVDYLNWQLIGVTALVGLPLGLLLVYKAWRAFDTPPRLLWVWLTTLLMTFSLGLVSWLLKVGNNWQLAVIIAAFGSVSGMLLGIGITWLTRPRAANAAADDDMHQVSDQLNAYQEPTGYQLNLTQLEQCLHSEKNRCGYPLENFRLVPTDENRLLVNFTYQTKDFGIITYYIICNVYYPGSPPEQVDLEVYRAGLSKHIDYDDLKLRKWQKDYNLGTLVKDGVLQVELYFRLAH